MSKTIPIYDVAISFAGADRAVAADIAASLVTKGINVFYDEYAEADLWGKDLYAHLTQVYRDDSKFCLMLISDEYAKKQWTSHERRAAQARAFNENREYILPLRLDDAAVEGVLATTGYVDLRKKSVDEITDLDDKKVKAFNREQGIRYDIVRAEDVFERAGIDGRDGYKFKDADFHTECPTCKHKQTLAAATLTLDDSDTVYTCKNGCQPIAVVSRPGLVPWPGRGSRLGAYVLRNASDMSIMSPAMVRPAFVPACKAALMKKRPSI